MQRRETTLELIQRLAPRQITETRNVRNHYQLICPICNYESRAGTPTCTIHQNQNQWHCFACNNGGGPGQLLTLLGEGPMEDFIPPNIQPLAPAPSGERPQLQGASVQALALAKGARRPVV